MLISKRTTVITNAGGMNPVGLKEHIEEINRKNKWDVKVAAVYGDDISGIMEHAIRHGTAFSTNGEKEEMPHVEVGSANLYFGASGIVEALRQGAQVIVTGRTVDSALVLAPLIFAHAWDMGDYQRLAQGSVIGHILECGCQATGGNYTDWKESVAQGSWVNMGYPIAECFEDGSAFISKNEGTAGVVNVKSVTEQMLYEIGNPSHYILPDVVVDFTSVSLCQSGPNKVKIWGHWKASHLSLQGVCDATQRLYHRWHAVDPWRRLQRKGFCCGQQYSEECQQSPQNLWKKAHY